MLSVSVRNVRRLVGRLVRSARSDVQVARQRRSHIRRGGGPSVLVVDQLAPDPRLGAGYPRAFALVRELVGLDCRVGFYGVEAAREDLANIRPAFEGKVHFFPPYGVDGLQRLLRTHGASFDLLVISRPGPMTAFANAEWRPTTLGRPFVVYDAEAVLAPREERRRALFGGAAAPGTGLATELAPARVADAVTAVGPSDASAIASAIGKPVVILSHVVEPRPDTPPFGARADILFVGRMTGPRDESPNVDSVVWFVTEIMPLLDRLIGTGYTLHLVGMLQAPEIEALLSDRVVSHGTVDDLAPFYDRCRVFVAPTRYAAGIPLKLVEALAQGIACVATPLLAEQLGMGDDSLPSGATADEFARECAHLYQDETRWSGVTDAGFRHAAANYSRAAFRASIEQLLALES